MKIRFYVWYKDTDGELQPLYVGQTNDPGRRRKEHGLSHPMRCKVIPRLSVDDVKDPNKRYKAGFIEAFLIDLFGTDENRGGLNKHLPVSSGHVPRGTALRLRELAKYSEGVGLAELLGLKILSKKGITEGDQTPEVSAGQDPL